MVVGMINSTIKRSLKMQKPISLGSFSLTNKQNPNSTNSSSMYFTPQISFRNISETNNNTNVNNNAHNHNHGNNEKTKINNSILACFKPKRSNCLSVLKLNGDKCEQSTFQISECKKILDFSLYNDQLVTVLFEKEGL